MHKPPIKISIGFKPEPEIEISAEGFDIVEIPLPATNERLIYIGYGTLDDPSVGGTRIPEFSKGWLLQVGNNAVVVRTDRIGLHPLYFMQTRKGYQLSDMAGTLLDHADFKPDIDRVGFWQSLAYESPLRNRTLFTGISQLGAGEEIRLEGTRRNPKIKRYWLYTGFGKQKIRFDEAVEHAAELFIQSMDNDFPTRGQYLLPLSGGADSRLMAVLLHGHVAAENITTVTYAHSKASLEYRIAANVCRRLGLTPPAHHRLTARSYLNGAHWLPKCTAGTIPFSNVHLLDYLVGLESDDKPPIIAGTAYSDALCGYSASGRPKDDFETWKNCGLRARMALVNDAVGIDRDILEQNDCDIAALAEEWRNSEITSFDEFNYIVERHVKFHHVLARTWMLFAPVANPFLSDELRQFFFALPPEFRHQKAVEIAVVDRLAPELKPVGSSSSMVMDGRHAAGYQKALMKSWNGINTVIRSTIGPAFEIPNPYLTEELGRVLNSSFKSHLKISKRYLADLGLLSSKQEHYFDKPLKRMGSIGTLQYFAINAAETISHATSKESLMPVSA